MHELYQIAIDDTRSLDERYQAVKKMRKVVRTWQKRKDRQRQYSKQQRK